MYISFLLKLIYNIMLVSGIQHSYNVMDYIPCAVHDSPVSYLIHNW